MTKRFLLFAGDDYYPKGGALDLLGAFDSAEEAESAHDPKRFNYDGGWANILDVEAATVLRSFCRGTWCDGSGDN